MAGTVFDLLITPGVRDYLLNGPRPAVALQPSTDVDMDADLKVRDCPPRWQPAILAAGLDISGHAPPRRRHRLLDPSTRLSAGPMI